MTSSASLRGSVSDAALACAAARSLSYDGAIARANISSVGVSFWRLKEGVPILRQISRTPGANASGSSLNRAACAAMVSSNIDVARVCSAWAGSPMPGPLLAQTSRSSASAWRPSATSSVIVLKNGATWASAILIASRCASRLIEPSAMCWTAW